MAKSYFNVGSQRALRRAYGAAVDKFPGSGKQEFGTLKRASFLRRGMFTTPAATHTQTSLATSCTADSTSRGTRISAGSVARRCIASTGINYL